MSCSPCTALSTLACHLSCKKSYMHEFRPNSHCHCLSGRQVMWINSLTTWWKMPRQESAIAPITSSKVTLCLHRCVIQRFKAGPHLVLYLPELSSFCFLALQTRCQVSFLKRKRERMTWGSVGTETRSKDGYQLKSSCDLFVWWHFSLFFTSSLQSQF